MAERVLTDSDIATTLDRCPIGLFRSVAGSLCLKTEYGNNEGRIDAYIIDSGEFFWGDGAQTIATQRAQLVYPVLISPLGKEAGPVSGHPSIAADLTPDQWPTWAEIDAVAKAHDGEPLMSKIIRAAHGGMMHGPKGLRLLYDIRHAMGWNDLTDLSIMAGGIARMRKSHEWTGIEWAPKDGTHLLVKFEGTTTPPTVAHYWSAPDDPGGWFLSVQQFEGPEIFPTHYQRLPAERVA